MSKSEISRRKFIGGTGSLALAVPLAAIPAAAQMTNTPPARQRPLRGPAVIPYRQLPVRQRGATVIPVDPPTDGVSDCAPAIQAAINALPEDGGTVLVRYHTTGGSRDCIYMIDATANTEPRTTPRNPPYYGKFGIRLRSNMLLQFEPGVQLQAMPNNEPRAYLIYAKEIHDVEIAGGGLIGERFTHTNSGTGTDEWGHGIVLVNVTGGTIRSTHVSDFEGDGIDIATNTQPSDIVLWDVVSTGNRRQAVSITRGDGISLLDSEFSYTHGTLPEDGVDIEGSVSNVTIDNCIITGNQGNAVEMNASNGPVISNVSITNCTLSENYSGIYAGQKGTGVLETVMVYGNAIYQNRATGIYLRRSPKNFTFGGTSACDPRNNSFANNQADSTHNIIYPISARQQEQGYVAGTDMAFDATALAPDANNIVGWNFFYSPDPSFTGAHQHPCESEPRV